MAAKKTDTKPGEAGGAPKASAKKGGAKKAAVKKAAPKAAKVAKKAPAKKAAAAAPKKAAPKKAAAAPVKLTDRQAEFLSKVRGASDPGYKIGQKAEQRTIDSLVEKKLLKRGAKDKVSGVHHYTLSKVGEKFLAKQPK